MLDQKIILSAAGLLPFPCSRNKRPSVPKGTGWQDANNLPDHLFSTPLLGVPIPDGVVVIDLDTYKGVTRTAVDTLIGCPLPWDLAIIQTTQSGGQHYAFRTKWTVKQGISIGVDGLDTRTAGKGYICTGEGYVAHGVGLIRLGVPESLPELPDRAKAVLEAVERAPIAPNELPTDAGEITAALSKIDPDCTRDVWYKIGMALRSNFTENPDDGLGLFQRWSSGELSESKETPTRYIEENVTPQWESFKPDGGVTLGSLFHYAREAGWLPPVKFDTAPVFARPDLFAPVLDRIRRDGSDITQTVSIAQEIKDSGFDEAQLMLAIGELKNQLKESGLKAKEINKAVDVLLKPADNQTTGYGKNDTENANIFTLSHYPNDTLAQCDGELYGYTGKYWKVLPKELLLHQVTRAMVPHNAQNAQMQACMKTVQSHARYETMRNGHPKHCIAFNNGVYNVITGQMEPHNQDVFNTTVLPYDWNPTATAHRWIQFLDEVFEGDAERIALLQEWFGYMMTPDYSHQKILFMLGPQRCGKGTIGKLLREVIGGENFSGGSLSNFADGNYIETLRNKTAIFIGDAEKKIGPVAIHGVIERLKAISGNDEVAFNRKYLSGLSESLPCRITMASNSIPQLFDDSGALAARLMPLPFYRTFYDNEDTQLADKLRAEIAGIAAWSVEGLRRLRNVGRFTTPTTSARESQTIAEAYSPLNMFIACCIEPNEKGRETSKTLYDAYSRWTVEEGENLLRPKAFTAALNDALRGSGARYGSHKFKDGQRARGFVGVSLIAQTAQNGTRVF